jgi:hypothetical protein
MTARITREPSAPRADDRANHVSRPTHSVARVPQSHAVRSARGLASFLGLLSLDGTLLEANHSAAIPPEFDVHDSLGQPFWEAGWWLWSPIVQHRIRESVAQVAARRTVRYDEPALVRHNQLITMDLAMAPRVAAGRSTAVIGPGVDRGRATRA